MYYDFVITIVTKKYLLLLTILIHNFLTINTITKYLIRTLSVDYTSLFNTMYHCPLILIYLYVTYCYTFNQFMLHWTQTRMDYKTGIQT